VPFVDETDVLYDPASEEWPDDRRAVVRHNGQLSSVGDIYHAAAHRYARAFPRVEWLGDGQRPLLQTDTVERQPTQPNFVHSFFPREREYFVQKTRA
jgi:hypothetical protein